MDWKKELRENVTTVEEVNQVLSLNLSEEEANRMEEIIQAFPMSVPGYYLSLIDKSDEDDPVKKLCIPSIRETDLSGSFDTSGESDNTVLPGLQHKYKQTALVLSTNQCAMYCRHCFRKRLVGVSSGEINKHFDKIISYINKHTEISNVLLSGGDSFLLDNEKIKSYLEELTKISHLDFIRFGTRTPVVFPMRIYEDEKLLDILKNYSKKKKIYIVTHFNHPNEITEESKRAVTALLNTGAIIRNQTVLLKGINDSADTLIRLIRNLTRIGVIPYYIFQCRPVTGVKNQFQVPLRKASKIIEKAKSQLNGQGKCFRYVMSNERGKIEILGEAPDNYMIFKYHQAKYEQDQGRLFSLKIAEKECWVSGETLLTE